MQKAKLSWLFIFNVFLIIVLVISLAKPVSVQSALSTHIVISEIQVAGAAAGDDFIELYNPTASDVSLDGMRIVKRTSSGTTDDSIVTFTSSDTIPTHGYFLWCNSSLNPTLSCNKNTADVVSNNNSVAIRNGALDSGAIVDAVTLGAPDNPLGEGTFLTAPAANGSVERKANSGSTADSMTSGADVNSGNGEDTDNNSNDFVLRLVSQPQNASSAAETPTASPTPSISPSPSASASASPSPSATASASPSASASASPIASPSASASASIAPSATPSASPSATPKPPKNKLSCSFGPQTFKLGKWELTFNVLSCKWTKV